MTKDWLNHPKLKGRVHPEFPGDVHVILHDGGPRLTDRSPEVVWVTVTGFDDNDIFTGRVLNQPQQPTSVVQGAEIRFIVPSGEHLLMVTEKDLQERPNWIVRPCNQCGLHELFDAPSELIRVIFPDIYKNLLIWECCAMLSIPEPAVLPLGRNMGLEMNIEDRKIKHFCPSKYCNGNFDFLRDRQSSIFNYFSSAFRVLLDR